MNKEVSDQPQAIRPGEELDIARLGEYLNAQLPDLAGPISIKQFPHGHSNLTYLLRLGSHELVLRRPPFGVEIKSAHDMGREFRVLSGVIKVYSKVPRPVLYCTDLSVMGAPFYLMERVNGLVLRSHAPDGIELTPEVMEKLSKSFTDNLVEIHGLDYHKADLGNLGRPEGYIQRQISGWTQRYERAKTDDVPDIERISQWLTNHVPTESAPTLIHNDYKYDNMMVDPNDLSRILAVFDWEMATIGDPLMDLGTSLSYWIEANDPEELQVTRFGLTTLPGNLSREQLVQRYATQSGRDVSQVVFYFIYGLFKLAVVAQQLYTRYKLGHTTDERYSRFLNSVQVLSKMALVAAEKNSISLN